MSEFVERHADAANSLPAWRPRPWARRLRRVFFGAHRVCDVPGCAEWDDERATGRSYSRFCFRHTCQILGQCRAPELVAQFEAEYSAAGLDAPWHSGGQEGEHDG